MSTGPQIVHKQFNSPIGLYSQQNIKATLNKHIQNLGNGSVGIDFSNPATEKPGNLANSAVLRMLEEEEHGRRHPGQKKVVWPPVPESNGYHQPQQQNPAYHAQHSPAQPSPQSHPQYQPQSPSYQQPQSHQQPQTYRQPQSYQQPQSYEQPPTYQQSQTHQQQSQPSFCEGRRQDACGLSKLIPVGPGITASPSSLQSSPRQAPQSPGAAYGQQRRWAPVQNPLSPQGYGSQPNYPQQQLSPQHYSPQHTQNQYESQQSQQQFSSQQYSSQQYTQHEYESAYEPPQRQFEPPPSTITLRPQPPIHQKPSPVFTSQPAAASYQGGVNMRGDQKWPPQSVKEAVAAENEARRQLAKGPACRPRKPNKDYRPFFAKHALNNNYPGYRAPPGTQHYDDLSGRSSY